MSASTLAKFTQKSWFPYLLIALAVLVAHGFALKADFYMDDKPHILTNERIQEGLEAPSGLKSRFLTFAVWRGVYLTFGNDPVAFHAVNLVLHLGVALLFFPVARRFLRLGKVDHAGARVTAFWGAVLFAVHPLVTEPVNYAAQTSMLLMTLLVTAACHCLLKWHETKQGRLLGWMALWVLLASHAKEPGFVHAAISLGMLGALVVSWASLKRSFLENKQARLMTLAGGGGVAIIVFGGWLMAGFSRFSEVERTLDYFLTQARVLGGYFLRMVYPVNLSSDHHVPWTTSAADLPALGGLLFVVLSTATVLFFVIRKRSWMAVLCGLILFHLYVRFLYSVDELMVEYRTYPSLPWFGLLVAWAVGRVVACKLDGYRVVRPAFLAAVTVVLVSLSVARSRVWETEMSISGNVLEQYPDNLRAWSIYLGELSERGDYETLASLRNMPNQVFNELFPPGFEKENRQFTQAKTYHNYIACQYPILKGMVHVGEVDEALKRSDALLVNVLRAAPDKNAKATFTILLAKLLAHRARGEDDKVEETLDAVANHYDEREKILGYLRTEADALPKQLAQGLSDSEVE